MMLMEFWEPLRLSITVTAVAGIIVIITGTLAGLLFARKQFKGKLLMETCLMMPLVLPPSVIGFLLIVIFGNQSIIGTWLKWLFGHSIMFTWYAAVIAATVVAFPLMFQTAKAGFQGVQSKFEEAARDLGANRLQVLRRVTLPLAKRALVAGSILSCTRALGEFGATLMFAGNIPGITQTVPTAIYMAIDRGDMTLAWLWVASIVLISFGLLLVARTKEH